MVTFFFFLGNNLQNFTTTYPHGCEWSKKKKVVGSHERIIAKIVKIVMVVDLLKLELKHIIKAFLLLILALPSKSA